MATGRVAAAAVPVVVGAVGVAVLASLAVAGWAAAKAGTDRSATSATRSATLLANATRAGLVVEGPSAVSAVLVLAVARLQSKVLRD